MRRICLTASFMGLVLMLALLWTHRFERVPGLPVWSMADLRRDLPEPPGVEWTGTTEHPAARLKVDAQKPSVALRLAIPGAPALEMLQLRYRMVANGLIPGKEEWAFGRMTIEWHPQRGVGKVEQDPAGGIKLDEDSGNVMLIAVPENGPARPALRLEHLGIAGGFEVMDLELTAVRERAIWKTGRWFLVCGWLAWLVCFIGPGPGIARWRVLAAAAVWLLMAIHFVVPGPWKIQRPLICAFQLGEVADGQPSGQAPPLVAAQPDPAISSGAVPATGKLPASGGLALRIKVIAAQARPLLHILLLMGPVFVSFLLVGHKPTLVLAVLVSLAIEGAQTAFGYGFDWIDLTDLATDAIGILLGLWLAKRLTGILATRYHVEIKSS